jgi:subtilisin
MKKTKLAILVLISLLVISGVITAETTIQSGQRVYVLTDNVIIKKLLGAKHEFPNKVFSTEVSSGLKALSALGLIKIEPVQIYKIKAKPVCGDSILHPSENCEAPEYVCSEGYVCENCKCVEEGGSSERICYPDNQKPWGITKVNGGSGGIGINVAVLDTGIDRDHLDLVANIKDCVTKVTHFRPDMKNCEDTHGHGTHVAGTILANGGSDGLGVYGVAPGANLIAVKVCDRRGYCYGDDMAAGIYYAADYGTNIISMSIGGDNPDYQVLAAIDYATTKNVLVIAAAGNDGPDSGSIDYPGAYIKTVAVGAIDSTGAVPSWSSRGINDGDYVIEEEEVELGTPGVLVESTYKDGCYVYMSGTSMATPHVSGLAAKLWQGSASATRTYLQSIAKDIWTNGDDIATGFGLPVSP